MTLLFGVLTFVFTMLGGLFALKFKDKLHLILGFSAGAVIGVMFFDLLPESISLTSNYYSTSTTTSLIAVGFILFMILDRTFTIHAHGAEDHCDNQNHKGFHGALALCVHSFFDGLGIGLAFKVSTAVGAVVAVAVLVHDFSDGINTINYIIKNKGKSKTAFAWLIADAFAPVIGIICAMFFTVSDKVLGLILAIFCGFFLYIGASDLLPESHHQHPKALTTIMTILGIVVLYFATKFAG